MAKISAQETTPGQTFSTADLMLSTTSNPRAEFRFGLAFFSPVKEDVSSSSTDPSQPYHETLINTMINQGTYLVLVYEIEEKLH